MAASLFVNSNFTVTYQHNSGKINSYLNCLHKCAMIKPVPYKGNLPFYVFMLFE
jgi:hypothetical protein